MNHHADDALAGQAVYSPRVLGMYDWLVLGVSNRFIWRCPTKHLEGLYDEHVTANHLDVGVGTGYFLDRCQFPSAAPRIVLMDLNQNCLDRAAARIERYRPTTRVQNVLEPIDFNGDADDFDGELFDSIGLNYVLHCLPGSLAQKASVFDHLRPLLKPGGVIFGATLLAGGVSRNLLARKLMTAYNRDGIFTNENDTLEALRSALDERFDRWHVETIGSAALFGAWN